MVVYSALPRIYGLLGVYCTYLARTRSDIVRYELRAGRPPFFSQSFVEIAGLITGQPHLPIFGASPGFNAVVDRLLQKDPGSRATWDVSLQSLTIYLSYQTGIVIQPLLGIRGY